MSSTASPTLHLERWTVSSGSNVQSRGAVVIGSGDHQWDGAAEGNGPVDALFRAVDAALEGVLTGQPRLIAYDVHAIAEGPGAEGLVTVRIAPPASAEGQRARGKYTGTSSDTNIIAASIVAYIAAIDQLLAEAHWQGATDAAGNRRRAKAAAVASAPRRAEIDKDAAENLTSDLFER
jgi:hypothetical protein